MLLRQHYLVRHSDHKARMNSLLNLRAEKPQHKDKTPSRPVPIQALTDLFLDRPKASTSKMITILWAMENSWHVPRKSLESMIFIRVLRNEIHSVKSRKHTCNVWLKTRSVVGHNKEIEPGKAIHRKQQSQQLSPGQMKTTSSVLMSTWIWTSISVWDAIVETTTLSTGKRVSNRRIRQEKWSQTTRWLLVRYTLSSQFSEMMLHILHIFLRTLLTP